MHLMDSRGHVDSPWSLDEDQVVDIKRRFFFTHDVTKSEHFIVDRTDVT